MTTTRSRRLGLLAVLLGATVASPAAALAQDAAADDLPGAGTPLEPGRYVSTAIGPEVEFRVDDGWAVGDTPAGPIFTLERMDQPGTVLTITRFDGDVFLDSCDPTSLATVEPSVSRLAEVIAGNPFLVPAPPQAVNVDGYAGLQLDIGVPAFEECRRPFVLLWAVPIADGGEFVQIADQQSRFVMLDIDGDVLVIAIESFPGIPFGSFLEASMELVDSMRIQPGSAEPPSPTPDPATTPPADD